MEITTLRGICGEGEECPGIHRLARWPELLFVVAVRVDDPAVVAELGVDAAPGALVGALPDDLLPEVTTDRDPYPWARVLRGHPGTVFVTGSDVDDRTAADMLASRLGDGEFLMMVPDVALVEV